MSPGSRPSQRYSRIVGAVLLLGLGLSLLVLRCGKAADQAEETQLVAARALGAALGGDPEAFHRARSLYAEGARLFEPYPLFALEVVEVLRAARTDPAALSKVADGARPVFVAWLEGRLEDALVLAAKLPAADGGELMARLARDLVRAGRAP